jgi:phosphatidylglycerol:prolipoprotein diacylglycerol transferase
VRNGLPMRRLADAIVAPVALGQAVGRLGCFAAGCCWGKAAEAGGWSITFTHAAAHDQTGVPLHQPLVPVQLYQMTTDLLLAALLTWLWRKKILPTGTVAWLYMLLYSVSRGVVELWRGDAQRGMWLGDRISTSQMIGLFVALFAITMLIRGGRWRLGSGGAEAQGAGS